MAEPTKLNLYQKISAITDGLGLVQKDSNAPKEMGGFKFLSHGMLLGHLRGELTKYGVVIVPSGEEILRVDTYSTGSGKSGRIVTLKYTYRVINADNPAEYIDASWIGEGQDTADKAVQKAGTSAEKHFLMKLFKVGDKDDPDATKTDDMVPAGKTESVSASMNKSEPEKPTEKPVDVPVDQAPSNGAAPVDDSLRKNQIQALVWFGEQLPPSAGWFKGKIVPLVGLWENKKVKGTLTEVEKEAPSGVAYVFSQIAEAHHKNCGENCEHINAAQLAVILGGRITDPAK